jgi:hypothetical protein
VGKRELGDLAVDDPADVRHYRLFWVVILLCKFSMDYVFIVVSLVVPSRAIMQIDLYCWNYNFAGEDCDQYDYTEVLPLALIHGMRLFRRYAYKLLMLFERWLPNLMLFYCNTFFFYLTALGAGAYTYPLFQLNLSALYGIGGARRGCVARVKGVFRVCRVLSCDRHGSSSAEKWTSVSPWLGVSSAFDRLRWRGVADGWSKVVRHLPTKVAAFERNILTKDVRGTVAASPGTVLCTEAVSEGWGMFAQAWNEVGRCRLNR